MSSVSRQVVVVLVVFLAGSYFAVIASIIAGSASSSTANFTVTSLKGTLLLAPLPLRHLTELLAVASPGAFVTIPALAVILEKPNDTPVFTVLLPTLDSNS